jgi:hypothetical protein
VSIFQIARLLGNDNVLFGSNVQDETDASIIKEQEWGLEKEAICFSELLVSVY